MHTHQHQKQKTGALCRNLLSKASPLQFLVSRMQQMIQSQQSLNGDAFTSHAKHISTDDFKPDAADNTICQNKKVCTIKTGEEMCLQVVGFVFQPPHHPLHHRVPKADPLKQRASTSCHCEETTSPSLLQSCRSWCPMETRLTLMLLQLAPNR